MATPDNLSGTDEIESSDLLAVWSSRNRDSRRVSYGQFRDAIADSVENDMIIAVESANASAEIAQTAAETAAGTVAVAVDELRGEIDQTVANALAIPLETAVSSAALAQAASETATVAAQGAVDALAGAAKKTELAAPEVLPVGGYSKEDFQGILDYAKPMQSYASMLAYTGRAKGIRITTPGIEGQFVYNTAATNTTNGGTKFAHASGTGAWERLINGEVLVTWFGAIGTGASDGASMTATTAAINAAAAACAVNAYDVGRGGPTLVFPEALGYRVNGPCVVAAGVPVEMRNTSILVSDAANFIVLSCGEVAQRTFRCAYRGLDVRRDGNITRSSDLDIGIRIINAFFCDVEVRGARGFKIGFQLNGVNPGEGCYYNRVDLGYFFGNSINIDLKGGDGTSAGWVNENIFIGGECQGGSTDAYDRYGVRIWNSPAGSLLNDNNLFLKPSFEMNGPAGAISIPFLILHSQSMRIISARQEGANSSIFARIENNSKNTDIDTGHQQINENSLQDLSLEKSTTLTCRKTNWSYHGREIFRTEALGRTACKYNATRHHIPGLNFYRQVDTTLFNNSGPLAAVSGSKITVGATDAVARMLDTSRCKKFVVDIDADVGEYPWVVVQAFDAAGTVLTSAGSGHPYVSGPGFGWAAPWNGYAFIDSIPTERLFTVTDDVKFVRVGIYAGKLRGFSLSALGVNNQFATTYSGYEDIAPGSNIGLSAPTDGTWGVGRRVFNAAPTVGQPKSWICTVAGTPGTWVSEGNL